MKKYLTSVLFAFITIIAFAQNNYQDVIYLKSGSIIRGIIIEQIPNKSVKIETADKSVFVYQIDEIEKIAKESFVTRNSMDYANLNGYRGKLEIGYQVGEDINRLKLNFINGYQVNSIVSLGFGAGLRYYPDLETVLVPILGDIRANFVNYQISNQLFPYVSMSIGYSFDATYEFEPTGFILEPSLGFSYVISDKSLLNFGIGYEIQSIYSSTTLNAVSFNVGVSF